MLNWRVCHMRDGCTYDKIKKRKRKCRRNWRGPALLFCAGLIALCLLPTWMIGVIATAVLIAVGVLLLLG